MKILVTGGTGFLGSWITKELSDTGAEVRVTVRDQEKTKRPPGPEVEVVEGDLQDADFALRATKDCDGIVHCAALKKNFFFHADHPATVLTTNLRIDINVLEAARASSVARVLLIGSARTNAVALASPQFGYAWGKKFSEVLAEAYKHEYGMNVTAARIENTFGPGDVFDPELAQVIPALIARCIKGEDPFRIKGNPEEIRHFSFVGDVARSIIELIKEQNSPAVLAVAPSYKMPFGDIIREIIKACGLEPKIEFIGENRPNPTEESSSTMPVREVTPQFSLDEALRETVRSYRAESAGK